MVFLGKVRNLKQKREEKEKEEFDAARAAQIELVKDSPKKKIVKKYTQKEWNRFTTSKQQLLSNRYHVILTDHQTKGEKWKKRAKKINLKNFDKGMQVFKEKQDEFWREWDKGFDNAGFSKSKGSKSDRIFGTSKKNTRIM